MWRGNSTHSYLRNVIEMVCQLHVSGLLFLGKAHKNGFVTGCLEKQFWSALAIEL